MALAETPQHCRSPGALGRLRALSELYTCGPILYCSQTLAIVLDIVDDGNNTADYA